MERSLADLLVCPDCPDELGLELACDSEEGDEIVAGSLTCASCGKVYAIADGIPRFVETSENYAENFAFEWQRWGRVQIDSLAGHNLSEHRFVADSRFPPDWAAGKLLLDAGCGAGRFSDAAARLGARVVAVDLSAAVDAARANLKRHGSRVQFIQASLYRLPLRKGLFDAVFCMGVIQHTPDPRTVMAALPTYLKPGGRLALNFYEVDWRTKFQPLKYALRRFTPRLSHRANERLAFVLTAALFPLSWLLSHLRYVRFINIMLPICVMHDRRLTLRQQFAWTLLDTFDWYSPRYEIRQEHTKVAALLHAAGLTDVDSAPGLAWAVKPAAGS